MSSALDTSDGSISGGSSVAHSTVKEFKYTWVIKNFPNYRCALGQYLTSPRFTMGDNGEYEWLLDLCPNGYYDSPGYLSIIPRCLSANSPDTACITLSLADREDKESLTKQLLLEGIRTWYPPNEIMIIFNRFVERDFVLDETNGLLTSAGDLTVVCRMCFERQSIHSEKSDAAVSSKLSAQEISPTRRLTELNDFEQLLEGGKFSDVKLVVGQSEFRAHKSILAARSRVFSAMFECEMKEQKDNAVMITDIEPDVMQELLRWIYVGKVRNIQTLACDLLTAADKYELQGLKVECEEMIVTDLSVDNVGAILYLIDKYDTNKLRVSTLEFLSKHVKKLMDSENFKKVMASLSSSLLVDVISILSSKL